ncbi:Disease resistance-like protein DSC1 [Vitis vinifera]|uniref:Disease resistance-like protein DSC1 n=1 Tax=Vitis vinifera TaxID=29760 RepID=A0A438H626_VITVI|nr:Disease resistance-like protein DSC1 [Vitis vinifera]
MASSSTSLSIASSSSTHPWKYEVFLSFRGEDTRKSFTDHLHSALCQYGINTFIDDQFRRGEQISSALLRAIEESRFSIIVFSEHYASSSWCLDELTKILECVKVGGHTAFPVFYNVDPSHVRKQTGSYGVAFTKHEQVYRDNMEKVLKWREALTVASGLSGWDSRDRHKSKVIKEIVSKIWNELNDASSCNMEALVGMDSHTQNMVSLLCIGSDDVQMVGIWGMAGIGKSTIAKKWDGKLFGKNLLKTPGKRSRLWVNEDVIHMLTTNTGTEAVEGIVLDLSALKELNFSVDVFTKMNRLRVLRFCNAQISEIWDYAWKRGNYDSCKNQYPKCKLHLYGDFKFLSNNLKSLHWDGYPSKSLPSTFHPEKLVELKMSFSRLEQLWEGNKSFQKLKFIKLSHSQHLIKTPDFSGAPNLRRIILVGCTSLVKVHPSIGTLKKLIFLDLEGCKNLKSFSSSIHMESLQILNLAGCSKLKKFPEVQGAMYNLPELSLKGTAIKGLPLSIEYLNGLALLNLGECKSLESLPSCIFKLKSLKTLILSNCLRLKKLPEIRENMESLKELFLDDTGLRELPSSIEHLNELVLLQMKNCKKLASLPESIFKLKSLKTLTISNCLGLKKLPEIRENMESLKELFLDDTGLRELPSSIEHLNGLVLLKLKNCKKLASLPESICKLTSLQTLTLSGCSELKKLPDDMGSLQCLVKLEANRSGIQEVPTSITLLTNLQVLSLTGCKGGESKSRNLALSLRSSPTEGFRLSSLTALYSLKELNLSDCNLLEGALPSDLSSLSWLERLDLSRNSFITVPSLSRLPRLERLILEHCKSLQSLPELPSSIIELLANDCTSLENISYLSSRFVLRKFGDFNFEFCNCFRLMENEQSDTLEAILLVIRRFASVTKFMDPMDYSSLRTFASRIPYDAVVPGSSIPEWFTDQSVGCSVTVELPPHWYNTRLMGLAVCAVFHPNISKGKFGRSAYFSMNESGGFSIDNTASMHFSKAEHIWFGYRSLFGVVFSRSIDHLEVSFSESIRAGEVVKKCGVRLIFEQDLPFGREEMNHISQHEESEGSYYRWRLRYPSPARVVAKHGGLATPKILPRAKNWMEAKVSGKVGIKITDVGALHKYSSHKSSYSYFMEAPIRACKCFCFYLDQKSLMHLLLQMRQAIQIENCLDLSRSLPSDLGSLSSLERLDLSRNGFITVPGSLKRLIVEQHCKSLKSLPEPPSKRHCGSYSTGIRLVASIQKSRAPTVFNANITMGELGEFLCFSVNESGSFYIDDGASMHFSKAAHIWFGYRPLADLFWGSGGPFRNQSNTLKVSFSVSNSDGEGLRKWGSFSI